MCVCVGVGVWVGGWVGGWVCILCMRVYNFSFVKLILLAFTMHFILLFSPIKNFQTGYQHCYKGKKFFYNTLKSCVISFSSFSRLTEAGFTVNLSKSVCCCLMMLPDVSVSSNWYAMSICLFQPVVFAAIASVQPVVFPGATRTAQ